MKIKQILPLLGLPLLSPMLLAGCYGEEAMTANGGAEGTDSEPADSETADTDSETDYSIWDWPCSIVLDTTCDDFENVPNDYYSVPINFSDQGLTLVNAAPGHNVLLAERTVGETPVPVILVGVDYWSGGALVEVGLLDPESGNPRAVDIYSPLGQKLSDGHFDYPSAILGYPAVALLCADTGCGLYGLQTDTDGAPAGLTAMTGGDVPLAGASALAVVMSTLPPDSAVEKLCVAGQGIACFNGLDWTTEVEAETAVFKAMVVAMQGDSTYLVAAGDDGAIWTNRGGSWESVPTQVAIDFVSVSVENGYYSAGGTGGFVFGDFEHSIACQSEDNPVTAVFTKDVNPSSEQNGLTVTALRADASRFEIWQGWEVPNFNSCVGSSGLQGEPKNAGYSLFGGADAIFGFAVTSSGVYERVELGIGP